VSDNLPPLSLDRRTFIPIENSAGGVVDERTQFHFSQQGKNFRADYTGGDISAGHIIGQFTSARSGQMLYHCLTTNGVLKAGRADAVFAKTKDGDITMSLSWTWVSGADGSGTSEYIEMKETLP